MADDGTDWSSLTGIFKPIAELLTPRNLMRAGVSGGLGAVGADTSTLGAQWAAQDQRRKTQAVSKQLGLLPEGVEIPVGMNLGDVIQLHKQLNPMPKYQEFKPGGTVYKVPPGGAPEQAFTVPGAPAASRNPALLRSPGIPALERDPTTGEWKQVVGPGGQPYIPPRKPEKPEDGKLTTVVMPDHKPHRVKVMPNNRIVDLGEAPPNSSGAQTGPGSDASDIADSIYDGLQPPVTTGLYRYAGPVRAELSRRKYDLSTANRDWIAIQKHLSTLNGQQQERLRQAVTFTYDSLDVVEERYNEWKRLGGVSGFKAFNKAALSATKQLPGEMGAAGQNLEAQINDIISELATVYKGGNSSTDESLKVAAANLKADWNDETFKKALGQIRNNLRIRKNSILQSQPVGVSPASPYLPLPLPIIQKQPDSAGAAAAGPGKIRVIRKADKRPGVIPEANFDPDKYERVP